MNVVIISSEITFVPNNYLKFFHQINSHPSITGLILVKNRSLNLWFISIACIFTFSAPRFGFHLLRNLIFPHTWQKKKYEKFLVLVDDVNSLEVIKILKDNKVDLVINARSRSIFKKELLEVPKFGCLNIHHGLLPYQRGVMCDLWALAANEKTGFSFHVMTPKIDDGKIVATFFHENITNHYLDLISFSSAQEARELYNLLDQIEATSSFETFDNRKPEKLVYRKNPRLIDFYHFSLKGTKI